MKVQDQIEDALRQAFSPTSLLVHDESDSHRGHAGWREGGETHFRIEIVSARFAGLSRLQRHRMIHSALSPSPLDVIHALSISANS